MEVKKRLFIIRHGETEYNKKGIVQGSGIDAPLNDTGLAQAAGFYEAYQDYPFDKIYTSVLQRTKQSVQQFLDKPLPAEHLAELNEIHWGNKEGQRFAQDGNDEYLRITTAWQNGDTDVAIPGGESPEAVAKRLKAGLEHILKAKDEKEVLICMHGRALRIFMCVLLNYPLSCMDNFGHANLCLYQLNFTGNLFSVVKHNDQTHLQHLLLA